MASKKGGAGKPGKPGGGGGTTAEQITDARFSKMQSDPRFLNVPTKKKKVVIDERFKVRGRACVRGLAAKRP
jgi:hypothetical protein